MGPFYFPWGRGIDSRLKALTPSGRTHCGRACGRRCAPVAPRGEYPHLPETEKRKGPERGPFAFLAGGEGFEPPLTESESVVLPLDDPPIVQLIVSSGERD